MAEITRNSTLQDVAAIVSNSLEPAGTLRIVTPTQSVMDRLAAAIAWNDAQSREQAILVAANQEIDWEELRTWFANEGETDEEFKRFHMAVESLRTGKN